VEGASAHRNGYVKAARANRYHSDSAACRRVAVRAQQGFSGRSKAFKVDLVANAVSGAAKVKAVLGGDALKVAVVVHILKVCLKGVVVNV
jgi:hypothetical protein